MNVRKFLFSFVFSVMIFSSVVFAQNTHMGVPTKDMVVLEARCSSSHLVPCVTPNTNGSSGITYSRILPDGTREPDFKIPARKILVITDYEWSYSESMVLEDSVNDPVTVRISMQKPGSAVSISQSALRVTPEEQIISQQGHASGSVQMTSGFVASVVPKWNVNRTMFAPSIAPSARQFFIVLRGYLLDVK